MNTNGDEKNQDKQLFFYTAIFISFLLIFSIIFTFLFVILGEKYKLNNTLWFECTSAIIVDIITIPLIIIYCRKSKNSFNVAENKFKISIHTAIKLLGICFVYYLIANQCNFYFLKILNMFTTNNGSTETYVTENISWAYFILTSVILAPVYEEIIFRKIILSNFRKYGKLNCILISSTLFSLFHCNIEQFVYTFLLGVMLGTIVVIYNRIEYAIILHSFLNLYVLLNYFSSEAILNNSHKIYRAIFSLSVIFLLLMGILQLIKNRSKIKRLFKEKEKCENKMPYLLFNKGNILLVITVIIGVIINNFNF
jgi:membrane protease YdiL (CAAX protease family)